MAALAPMRHLSTIRVLPFIMSLGGRSLVPARYGMPMVSGKAVCAGSAKRNPLMSEIEQSGAGDLALKGRSSHALN